LARPRAVAGQIWCLTSSVRDAAASGLMLARRFHFALSVGIPRRSRGPWLRTGLAL